MMDRERTRGLPVDDEDFVAGVFDVSYRRLVGQLFVLCGDLPTAEDLVQEAFVRALDHGKTFRRTDNPEAWLRRVAVNLLRSRWRRLKVYARLQPRLAPETTADFEPSTDQLTLIAALARLPATQREAIVLHHVADLPVAEVSAIVGAGVNTVKTRLARGRAALAELLGENEERHV